MNSGPMAQRDTLRELVRVFGRIGLLSFGGPAAQIALMHRELVEERPWLSEVDFLRALSFCMMLPGPEAMQLATYAGWKLHGVRGGLIAGGLFVLPGAIVIFALGILYTSFGALPEVSAAFLGLKATVVVIVLQAILRLSSKALEQADHIWLAILALLALFVFQIPFPLVVGLAGAWGFCTSKRQATPTKADRQQPYLAKTLLIGAALWAFPITIVWVMNVEFLLAVGVFFSKLAVVTFGGAYAVLAYLTQEVVTNFGWLSTQQMIDALGLAETTPGPLILVTQFVGIIAGNGVAGWPMAMLAGAMTLWVTFVPCFIWIFAGAPLIDRLQNQPRLSSALSAITAAVVGVIANLSVWFATHVIFEIVDQITIGPMALLAPRIDSFDPVAVALIALAVWLLLRRKFGVVSTMFITVIASLALGALLPAN